MDNSKKPLGILYTEEGKPPKYIPLDTQKFNIPKDDKELELYFALKDLEVKRRQCDDVYMREHRVDAYEKAKQEYFKKVNEYLLPTEKPRPTENTTTIQDRGL